MGPETESVKEQPLEAQRRTFQKRQEKRARETRRTPAFPIPGEAGPQGQLLGGRQQGEELGAQSGAGSPRFDSRLCLSLVCDHERVV